METLVNFRDLGGYNTPQGKVKKGKFFRSGEPVELSEQDTKDLQEVYKIRYIYDFRQAKEVDERPDDELENCTYVHLDIMKDIKQTASLKSFGENNQDPDQAMKDAYESIVESPTSQALYKTFLESIYACEDDAILFHCFAGKDRTGLGAAFILKILGVSEEDIKEDYLKTNKMREVANTLILEEYRQTGASEEKLKSMEIMLYVKGEYLEYVFQLIETKFGGFHNYMTNYIGLSESFIENMKQRFVE